MYRQKFDCSYAKYVNIRKDVHFLFKHNVVETIRNVKSNFNYSILIDTKFHKPIQKNKWKKMLKVRKSYIWKNVYIYQKLKICMEKSIRI